MSIMRERIPGLSVAPFEVWTCKVCQSELRWVTLHDRSGGHHRIETISVYADPDPAGDVIHTGSGQGERLTSHPQVNTTGDVYRQHGPMCDGARCPRETDPGPDFDRGMVRVGDDLVTVEAVDDLFGGPIPDDFLFGGPPPPIPPPAPTGLHAEPQGIPAHQAATEAAIAQVDTNAPADWRVEADAAIRDVAARFEAFTADDVWDTGLTIPPTPSALGPVFRRAQADGIITPTDEAVESRYAHRHRKLKVWRSLSLRRPPSHTFEVRECSSCRSQIVWTVTPAGAKMPVDAAQVADGNVAVFDPVSPGSPPLARIIAGSYVPGTERLLTVSHFATCPNADRHRQR